MRKIGQYRSFLKILTFGQDLCKSQLSGNWTVCTISESQTKKWIPKSERMWKTEWDRSVLKILTFGQDSCKSQLFRNWAVCIISESRMKKWIPKLKCTQKIEWDRPTFTFWSKSKFKLGQSSFFFFFFGVGSLDRVRWMGQTGSAWTNGSENSGEWCHHDIIALEGHVWAHEASWRRVGDSRRMWAHEWHWWSSDLLVVSGGRCLGFLTWNFQVL